jgi:phage terminase small subunit
MPDLNDQQARFVEEYLIDLNATQAAIRAGYSEKTAYSQGQRLLKHVEVQAALSAAQKARSDRTKIDADWVLTRLADEAEADVADLYDDNGHLKPVKEWPAVWRKGLVAGIDVVEEFETVDGKKERVGIVRKLRLSERIKRIELIGKHVGVQAFRERVAHENPDGTPLEASSQRDVAREIAFALGAGLRSLGNGIQEVADKASK